MVASDLMQTDLSVWGMYQHADIVVKVVMIGLLLASVVTWAIFFGKYAELSAAKRRLKREHLALGEARNLNDAARIAQSFTGHSHSVVLLNDAQNELELSAGVEDTNGIKDRTSFRLERRVAAFSRHAGRGNGFLATIGSVAPFIGLFGTVWGIMNSFFQIGQQQNSSLAVVAPGISEALFATAIGLFAAIPAVIAYNRFSHRVNGFESRLQRFADKLHAALTLQLEQR